MSNLDILGQPGPGGNRRSDRRDVRRGGRRATKKRSAVRTIFVLLLAVLTLAGGTAVVLPKVLSHFSGPADFAGPGSGSVQIEITSGQTLAQIGNTLKSQGVVASVDGFTRAAGDNPKSAGIQPGFYTLKSGMASKDAITALLDDANRVTNKVVIPEGKRATWVLDTLAKGTGLPRADFDAAVKDSASLGLPDYAKGNVEGFLFPATYEFAPNATATEVLKTLVDKYNSVVKGLDLSAKSATLKMTPYQIITIASLLQVEGHPRDFTKVARVVYNRLAMPMRLEFDSTVNYGLGQTDVIITQKELDKDTPYNMYLHDGLPPTPIDNPGADAIQAALNPATGDWLYFITVDLETQETKFTKSYAEFLTYKNQFLEYCNTHAGSCW
jgi:UPF0755 protein